MNWEQNGGGVGYAQPTSGLGILTYPTHQRKRGDEGGGGGGERATHGKIEEKTGDERSIVISEEKSKLRKC